MRLPFCCQRNSPGWRPAPPYREPMAEIVALHRTPAPARVEPARPAPTSLEPLWREAVGDVLRRARHERGERLTDTAQRSGVSPQYLSEMERGLKEPSSEMIAAVAGALDLSLLDLATSVAEGLRPATPAAPSAVVRAA